MDDREREQKRIDAERMEDERRKWLMSVCDEEAERLSIADKYDRIRYLRFEESQRQLKDALIKPSMHWNREWKNLYN